MVKPKIYISSLHSGFHFSSHFWWKPLKNAHLFSYISPFYIKQNLVSLTWCDIHSCTERLILVPPQFKHFQFYPAMRNFLSSGALSNVKWSYPECLNVASAHDLSVPRAADRETPQPIQFPSPDKANSTCPFWRKRLLVDIITMRYRIILHRKVHKPLSLMEFSQIQTCNKYLPQRQLAPLNCDY